MITIAVASLMLTTPAPSSAASSTSSVEIAVAPVVAPCAERTRAAVAFTEDSHDDARASVETELARGCFVVDSIDFASEPEMFAAAGRAPWLIVVKAALADASVDNTLPYTTMPTYGLTVDLTAFDVKSGQRRGRALRSAHLVATNTKPASSREAVRVIGDAVRVLRGQLEEPTPDADSLVITTSPPAAGPVKRECTARSKVVVLWHKATTVDGRVAVTKALGERCFDIAENIEANRNEAMEWARDLELPLLAVKATSTEPAAGGVVTHVVSVTADLVDAKAEGLVILAHAAESANALRAGNEADAWTKVEQNVVAKALERVLPK